MKYPYMKLSGYVTVTVDPVDIEQERIAQPHLSKAETWVMARIAAVRKEGYLAIARAAFASGYELKPELTSPRDDTGYEVRFIITRLG